MKQSKPASCKFFAPDARLEPRPNARAPTHRFLCATCATERTFKRDLQDKFEPAYLYCKTCDGARKHWHSDHVQARLI